jgi:hypothetical protein
MLEGKITVKRKSKYQIEILADDKETVKMYSNNAWKKARG